LKKLARKKPIRKKKVTKIIPPKSFVVDKPIEKSKDGSAVIEKDPILDELESHAYESEFPPASPKLIQCDFTGIIEKSPRFGNSSFAADETPHQKHTRDHSCKDVLFMEKEFGRHAEGCAHVGFWTNKACGCNK